jgi:hypothetical protein
MRNKLPSTVVFVNHNFVIVDLEGHKKVTTGNLSRQHMGTLSAGLAKEASAKHSLRPGEDDSIWHYYYLLKAVAGRRKVEP